MRYIGLLRAVNVGGKKKIKMAELRDALAALDLQHVRTYIQSGNILFDSDDTEDSLYQRIEHHIEQRFGFAVEIILRTLPEFDSLVADCPFAEYAARHMPSSDPIGLYVAFLNKTPPADAIAALTNYVGPEE